jgi:hypothetical protein
MTDVKHEIPEDLRKLYSNARWNDAVIHYADKARPRSFEITPTLVSLIERIAQLTAENEGLKSDWKRLNRVFKSTSDKTIDQDIQIERLTAALREMERLQNPITLVETLTHSRICSAGYDLDSDCICGLDYRIQLQTSQNLHAAWMKRALEAEIEVERLRDRERVLAEAVTHYCPVEQINKIMARSFANRAKPPEVTK